MEYNVTNTIVGTVKPEFIDENEYISVLQITKYHLYRIKVPMGPGRNFILGPYNLKNVKIKHGEHSIRS